MVCRPDRDNQQSEQTIDTVNSVKMASTKYPEIKQRGFYSDVVSDGAQERLGVSYSNYSSSVTRLIVVMDR